MGRVLKEKNGRFFHPWLHDQKGTVSVMYFVLIIPPCSWYVSQRLSGFLSISHFIKQVLGGTMTELIWTWSDTLADGTLSWEWESLYLYKGWEQMMHGEMLAFQFPISRSIIHLSMLFFVPYKVLTTWAPLPLASGWVWPIWGNISVIRERRKFGKFAVSSVSQIVRACFPLSMSQ
jgi:hypothetical protein